MTEGKMGQKEKTSEKANDNNLIEWYIYIVTMFFYGILPLHPLESPQSQSLMYFLCKLLFIIN